MSDLPAIDSSACARAVMDAVLPVMCFMRRQMRGHRGELSLSQFRILVRISREPAASLSSLAEHLGSSLSALSRAVSGLVDKGLLKRVEASGDRRQLWLALTPQGQAVLDRAHRGAQVNMGAELAPLDQTQRAAIAQAMLLLRDVFGLLSRPEIEGAAVSPPGEQRRPQTRSTAGARKNALVAAAKRAV